MALKSAGVASAILFEALPGWRTCFAQIERASCSVKLLKTPKTTVPFYDFDEYERLLGAARSDPTTYLIALLGGEAGLRCGEIKALEWTDIDLKKRQLCVARSEWNGPGVVPRAASAGRRSMH